jgi:hypothetical protein
MIRKAQKKERLARQMRVEYVLSAALMKDKSLISPFLNAAADDAARVYINTGDESLKEFFPKPVEKTFEEHIQTKLPMPYPGEDYVTASEFLPPEGRLIRISEIGSTSEIIIIEDANYEETS